MSLVYMHREFERPPHPSFALINQATTPPLFSPAIDFSAGTKEDWREDADDFPEVALGEPLGDWQGEVWVDINNEVWMDDVVHLVLYFWSNPSPRAGILRLVVHESRSSGIVADVVLH